jgi:hypothetical protein
MEWAESRRKEQPAHKPVKCLEGQQYRTLWTMAGGNRSCSESKTTETVVARNREFTTDLAVTSETEHGAAPENETGAWASLLSWNREFTTDMRVGLPIMSVGVTPPLKPSPNTTFQRVTETAVTSEAELGPAPESETVASASVLSWDVNTLMVIVILPITLGVAVFVSLIAVHYVTKGCRIQHPQHHKQGKGNHVAAFPSTVPLLKTQPTTELMKSQEWYENRNSDDYNGAVYHLYERID